MPLACAVIVVKHLHRAYATENGLDLNWLLKSQKHASSPLTYVNVLRSLGAVTETACELQKEILTPHIHPRQAPQQGVHAEQQPFGSLECQHLMLPGRDL